MTTELAMRDGVTVDGEIIEAPQPGAPLTLFGTDDPAAVVERATKVATVLADVIEQRRLSARIGNRDHIMLEGWTLLGSMLGVFGEVEWTRSLEDGWEARAVARTMGGAVVGSAEAMCTRSERTWRQRDEYAIRSMAQTRALSKALRLPLGFIVELAGFAATPAEELDGIEQPQGGERRPSPVGTASSATTRPPAPRNRGEAQQAIATAAKAHGLSFSQIEETAKRLGIKRGDASMEDLGRLLAAIERPESGSAHPAPAGDTPDEEARSSPATAPDSVDGAPSPPESGSAQPTMDDVLAAAGEGAEEVAPMPDEDPEGYEAWYKRQPSEKRALLRSQGRAPKKAAKA